MSDTAKKGNEFAKCQNCFLNFWLRKFDGFRHLSKVDSIRDWQLKKATLDFERNGFNVFEQRGVRIKSSNSDERELVVSIEANINLLRVVVSWDFLSQLNPGATWIKIYSFRRSLKPEQVRLRELMLQQ